MNGEKCHMRISFFLSLTYPSGSHLDLMPFTYKSPFTWRIIPLIDYYIERAGIDMSDMERKPTTASQIIASKSSMHMHIEAPTCIHIQAKQVRKSRIVIHLFIYS